MLDITHVFPILMFDITHVFPILMFDITHVFHILMFGLMFDITHVSPILMFDNIRYYTCVIYLDFAPLLLHFVLPLAYIWISLTDHWLISLCCV